MRGGGMGCVEELVHFICCCDDRFKYKVFYVPSLGPDREEELLFVILFKDGLCCVVQVGRGSSCTLQEFSHWDLH